jgi:DNA-binding Lrp family transcriptional regulator
MSYEVMSRKFGVTANAIKSRVERLQKQGIIAHFALSLSPAMTDATPFLALAYSNSSLNDDSFINSVGNHRLVSSVGFDSYGACVIVGAYRLSEEINEFGEFVRGFDRVRDCEIHPLPTRRGGKRELSTLHLRVIKSLRNDPRKSITSIAADCGLTARRVRSILNNLIEEDVIRLTIRINPNAGDTIWVVFRIRWDSRVTSGEFIGNRLREAFPHQFFQEYHSAIEPLMWTDFLVEKVSESERITHEIKSIPSARVENTILPFPMRFFPGLADLVLDELLKKAGLL